MTKILPGDAILILLWYRDTVNNSTKKTKIGKIIVGHKTTIRTTSHTMIKDPKAKRIGLVFSGGGARGSFQIGVWQALMDLGLIPFVHAAYGTSVGSINGAAFVQTDIQLALEVWQEITFSKVFANHPDSVEDIKVSRRVKYFNWLRGMIENKGFDVSPLKKIIRNSIDEDKVRQSEIEFGLVVFDLSNRQAQYLTKKDIPEGQIPEYIIASATFPGFQPHRIEDRLFIDGGVYDNRPLSFYDNHQDIDTVIVIDVTMARHVWPNKRVRGNVEMVYVRPTQLLGSPLAFQTKRIKSNLELGYRDTMDQLKDFSPYHHNL